jgi:8-oxo-dGTP diphosphatase
LSQKVTIRVVAAILKNEHNQYLITKRLPDAHLGGFWEFPGGTVENGESDRAALTREIKEELDISIIVGELFWHGKFDNKSELLDINFYNCDLISPDEKIELLEIADYRWIAVSEFDQYKFPKSDTTMISWLRRKHEIKY